MRPDWRLAVAVGLGGALGSVARYLLGTLIQTRTTGTFPVATLIINVSGSLLLGFLMQFGLETRSVSPEMRLFLTTGFCGGYTTFSTFSYETVVLLQAGAYLRAGLYMLSSVFLSLTGTILGIAGAKRFVVHRRATGRS